MKKLLLAFMVLAAVSCSKTEVVQEPLPEAEQIVSVDFVDQNLQIQSSNQIQVRLR